MNSRLHFLLCTSLVTALVSLPGFTAGVAAQDSGDSPELKPVALESGVAKLTPENTRVEFVGTHVGEEPKPRLGGFTKFKGQVSVQDGAVSAVEVEFDMNSIWTEFDDLTAHLKNADFFHVEEYPTARFSSIRVAADENGQYEVLGDLTMHGKTAAISFPAAIRVGEDGLTLRSQFKLDRTRFAMDQMTSGVEAIVSLEVIVGLNPGTANCCRGRHSGSAKFRLVDQTP